MTREITKITETPEADRDEWRTPPEVFALAERLVGRSFDLDAAADKANALCRWWCGPTQIGDLEHLKDGLLAEWRYHERVWCNPPFSRGNLPRWTLKAVHEAIGGCTSCLLLPFTGDDWFCQNVVGRAQIVLLTPRVAFLRPDGSVGESPRTASCLAIYRPGAKYDGPLTVERWRV